MNIPKRPRRLLTAAQAICVLAIALTLVPALLPTYILVSLLEKAEQYHSAQSLELYTIGLCARDLALGICLFCAEIEAIGLLQRLKKASAFSRKNEKALGHIALALGLSSALTLLFGDSVVPFLMQGLNVPPVLERLLLPFMLLTLAGMLRTVQLLMRRAMAMQDENALTV
nr:DUF2975 domain-containing protein [Clostridia bacterium]